MSEKCVSRSDDRPGPPRIPSVTGSTTAAAQTSVQGGGDVREEAAAAVAASASCTAVTVAAAAQAKPPDEVAELSDRIRKALECPVCMEVTADMDCHCPNGHALCGPCLVQLQCTLKTIADSSCPMCRAPMSYTVDGQVTARRLLLALPLVSVACRYRPHGCGALDRVDRVARHEADCRYWPDVRCLVNGCRWLSTYERLFEHAVREHRGFAVHTTDDRMVATDTNSIESNRRRVYLVKTDDSGGGGGGELLWVLMFRESRNRIQAGVFTVESRFGGGGGGRSANMGYRVTYLDSRGRSKTRSKTCRVGQWHLSMNADSHRDDKAESYTYFRSGEGRVEITWFDHVFVRRTRNSSRRAF